MMSSMCVGLLVLQRLNSSKARALHDGSDLFQGVGLGIAVELRATNL